MRRRSSSPGHRDHRPAASNGGAFDLSRETLRQINTVSRSLDAVADMIAIRERQLQQALRDAAAAARAKAEFLANMSHELRTPLNSIIGFAALIRDGSPGDPECVSDYAAAIETSGLSLLALLNDLLDLSQLGDDALALEEQPVDLARIIADCIEAITACARKSGVTLHLDLAPHLPWIIADPVRIEQILRHLLSNAIKFSRATSGGRSSHSSRSTARWCGDIQAPVSDLRLSSVWLSFTAAPYLSKPRRVWAPW